MDGELAAFIVTMVAGIIMCIALAYVVFKNLNELDLYKKEIELYGKEVKAYNDEVKRLFVIKE